MRAVLTASLTLALVLGAGPLALSADAATARKHKKQYSTSQNGEAYRNRASRQGAEPEWYPHDSSQLPVGSKRWWEQKERESGGSSRD